MEFFFPANLIIAFPNNLIHKKQSEVKVLFVFIYSQITVGVFPVFNFVQKKCFKLA